MIGQFLFFGLYFSIVGQSVGSVVCKVFVLCLTPTLSSVLCFCVILSVMSNILFSSSVSEAYVFVSSLSLHQVLGCYSIPLNMFTIFSVSIESTQSCSVLSSNILQLLWYQAGGLAGQGTVSVHLFFFCSFRGQALPPFLGPDTTLLSLVSQPRPQEVEQADQSLQGEVTQSSGRGASSCRNPSLVSDWDWRPRNLCLLASCSGWHALRHSVSVLKLFLLPPHPEYMNRAQVASVAL